MREWPVLWISEEDVDRPTIGTPEIEWHGERLDILTTGDWTLRMARGNLATVTISIPVRVRVRPKP